MGLFDREDEGSDEARGFRAELTADELRSRVLDEAQPFSRPVLSAIAAHGTPLITDDPDDPRQVRALFTWQQGDDSELAGVYLWANRLTDKHRTPLGMMRLRTGSHLWFVELTVPRDTVASYRIQPLSPADGDAGEIRIPPPRELLRWAEIDPHNPAAAAGAPFGSVLVGPDAPGIDAWTAPSAGSSTVVDRTVDAGGTPVRYRVCAPPGSDPMDLLIVFDADLWFDRLRLADVLARPSGSGRRFAVLGIDSPADPAARLHFLGARDDVFDVIADDAIAESRRCAGPIGRVVIVGQSLGGLSALAFATTHPDLVDEVLAYSPSVWWRPGLSGRPADVSARQEWIHDRVAGCSPGAFTIRLAAGRFEDELTPAVAQLADTARAAGHAVTFTTYSGGHDAAQWAALVLADLSTVDGDTTEGE